MSLITLQQAKDYLQITTTATDTLISNYIELVSAEVEAYTDRRFSTVTYTEVLHSKSSRFDYSTNFPLQTRVQRPQFRLRQFPIQSFIGLVNDTTTFTSDDYTLDEGNGIISMYAAASDYRDQLQALYVAGYTTVTGTAYTVPYELQAVALEGVKVMYMNGGSASQGTGNVKSKSLKDFSVTYGGNEQSSLYVKDSNGVLQKSYIAGFQTVLDRYKFVAL